MPMIIICVWMCVYVQYEKETDKLELLLDISPLVRRFTVLFLFMQSFYIVVMSVKKKV